MWFLYFIIEWISNTLNVNQQSTCCLNKSDRKFPLNESGLNGGSHQNNIKMEQKHDTMKVQ